MIVNTKGGRSAAPCFSMDGRLSPIKSGTGPAMTTVIASSRTPRRAATRVALHAGAVAHQREVAALRAHLAFVAPGLGFGAAFGF